MTKYPHAKVRATSEAQYYSS